MNVRQVYDEHAQSLYGYLLNLTRNESDTRDVLQDIFMQLAVHPDLWEGVRDPRGFLIRMAHNKAIDLVRRNTARRQNEEKAARDGQIIFDRTDDPDANTYREDLSCALEKLPPEQREVVHLKIWEGMTFKTIAETLAIPLDTAASRYRYALEKLRTELCPS